MFKIIVVLLITSGCFFLNNPSFAETASEQEIPAVELKKKGEDNEKNIVPVLDLKGGISSEVRKENPFKTWIHQDTLTGNWRGLRSTLEEHGIIISGSYTTGSFLKSRGGGLINQTKPSYQGVISTSVELDSEKMGLYKGGKAFVSFQNIHGKGLSEKYVGDYMYFDSYDSYRNGPQLSEYWYEQSLFGDKFKLKAGKQDACAEFMSLDTGSEFINSGFTFITNAPIPTYPDPAIGFVTTVQPINNLYFKYGFFDGNGVGDESGFNTIFHPNSSYMHIGEVGITHSIRNHPGKFLYGMWLHTADVEELLHPEVVELELMEPAIFPNNYGLYAEFEQMIFKEKFDNSEDDQGLTLVGQFGWAPSKRNELEKQFGVALAYKGIIPRRNDDLFGVGGNFAKFSNKLGSIKGENILEVFYKIQLTPWLSLQPDFQYINKPYYADRSSFTFGIRTNVDL